MYQGHTTRQEYIDAWNSHISQLQWMFWETAPENTAPNYDDATRYVNGKMDALRADIEAAADALVAKGKLKGEPMKDTPMDLRPDPMCIPTMGTLDWQGHKSLATAWRDYIEYCLSQDNPSWPELIY
jgi:hypothetical protein